jgi:nucleotide-binding universal stress UspA family protein
MKRPSIRNILVPIDFSKLSIQAIETAKRLAQHVGATIHLAHIHQFDHLARFMAPASPLIQFSAVTFERDAEERLARQLKILADKHGLSSASIHLLTGAPAFNEICRLAKEIPADLVVMPTHGRTGLKHVFLGSTAERIVQHSPCPVLVVRERRRQSKTGPPLTVKRILVPVDFSECSQEGLQYAIGFANQFGSRIMLLHATYLGYIYSTEGTVPYDVRGLQKAARENAERQMRKLVRAAKFGRVKYEIAFIEGSPVLDICAFAKEHNVDVIITSTHGLTGFEHVLIGSIAEKVVRYAPCSVLVVPSHPKVRAAKLGKTRVTKPRALANSPRQIRPVPDQQQSRRSPRDKALIKRDLKLALHAFPERRKTNKFRESHSR